MSTYKLILDFYSPVVYQAPPMLDSIILYCLYMKYKNKKNNYNIPGTLKNSKQDIELTKKLNNYLKGYIERHENSLLLCSSFIPLSEKIEHTEFWVKKFDTQYLNFLKRGKAKKIQVGTGFFRSYKMPIFSNCVKNGYFIFKGDGPKIKQIMQSYIIGIGKKVSSGYGWISDMKLKEMKINDNEILKHRPVPLDMAMKEDIVGRVMNVAYKSPYWDFKNMKPCIVPNDY